MEVSYLTNLMFALKMRRSSARVSSNVTHFASGIGEIGVF